MKIAVSGKGGAGKTTLSAGLLLSFAKEGRSVIGIDADPDANLLATLGYPEPDKITPIAEMKELIAERAGEKGGFFNLNPKVDDIIGKYSVTQNGIKLLVMGRIKKAGTGCYCPENALLKALMAHLILCREDVLVMDMEAGIEHLGRGTAGGVDALIMVVEPSLRSIETAFRIKELAEDLKIKNIFFAGNKIRNAEEKKFIIENVHNNLDVIGFIKYNINLIDKITINDLKDFSEIVKELKKRVVERGK